jgi:hypothetical protein
MPSRIEAVARELAAQSMRRRWQQWGAPEGVSVEAWVADPRVWRPYLGRARRIVEIAEGSAP